MAGSGSVDMVYGDSGEGKTAALGEVAEWYYAKTGKPSLLINTDPGGWATIQPHVDAGLVLPFKIVQERPHLTHTVMKLAQGYRPLDLEDPLSPLSTVPQTADIAAILFDGITSLCDMWFELHLHDITVGADGAVEGKNIKIAGTTDKHSMVSGPAGSDQWTRRIASQTDYGQIQLNAREILYKTSMLPIPAVWTALTCKSEDDDNKKPVYGPAFLGKSLTSKCGNLFGNLLHLYSTVDKAGEKTTLMYLKPHYAPGDIMRVPFPAKVRIPKEFAMMPNKVPMSMKPDMRQLYGALEGLQQEAATMLRQRFAAQMAAQSGAKTADKKNESPAPVGASN